MPALFRRRRAGPAPEAVRFRAAPGVVSAQQGARMVMLDPRRGEYFGLDEVGAAIWTQLAEGRTLTELVDALEREYAAPRAELERDAAAFVARLEKKHLVVRE